MQLSNGHQWMLKLLSMRVMGKVIVTGLTTPEASEQSQHQKQGGNQTLLYTPPCEATGNTQHQAGGIPTLPP